MKKSHRSFVCSIGFVFLSRILNFAYEDWFGSTNSSWWKPNKVSHLFFGILLHERLISGERRSVWISKRKHIICKIPHILFPFFRFLQIKWYNKNCDFVTERRLTWFVTILHNVQFWISLVLAKKYSIFPNLLNPTDPMWKRNGTTIENQ